MLMSWCDDVIVQTSGKSEKQICFFLFIVVFLQCEQKKSHLIRSFQFWFGSHDSTSLQMDSCHNSALTLHPPSTYISSTKQAATDPQKIQSKSRSVSPDCRYYLLWNPCFLYVHFCMELLYDIIHVVLSCIWVRSGLWNPKSDIFKNKVSSQTIRSEQ